MRYAALLVLLSSVAYADKPKGRLIDPWGRIPRPRDNMKLPDPRKAAEKATTDGVVAPTTPEPTEPTEPTDPTPPAPEPQLVVAPPVEAVATLPPPSTPFGVTKLTYKEPPPVSPHEGLTLEAGIGFGVIYVTERNHLLSSPGGVGGLDLGIGAWLSRNVALTVRLAGSSTSTNMGVVVASYLGPSLQIWATDSTWIGFGIGLTAFSIDSSRDEYDLALGGAGFDFRLGHTIYETGKHSLNGSLEITPGRVSDDAGFVAANVASVGLLFGWQYL
jgi:hypothetical protein